MSNEKTVISCLVKYLSNFGRFENSVTTAEIRIWHPVGKTSHANPDAFEDTIAGQLMEDESGLDLSGHLVVVGHDATDEVGLGGVEGRHQRVQLLLVEARHRLTTATLCL
jgi:hypothetical protein